MRIRIIFFLNLSWALMHSVCINCQTDTVYYINTTQYKLVEGEIEGSTAVVNQKTFDKSGEELLIERIFDFEQQKQTDYILYFYTPSGQLKTKEKYTINHQPVLLKQYFYNNSGDTILIKEYTGKDSIIELLKTIEFSYDNDGQLVSKKIQDKKGKLLHLSKFKQPDNNKIIELANDKSRKLKYTVETTFNDRKLPEFKTIRYKKSGTGLNSKRRWLYRNDTLTGIIYFDAENPSDTLKSMVYEYNDNGQLWRYYELNADNIKTRYYSCGYYRRKINFMRRESFFVNQ